MRKFLFDRKEILSPDSKISSEIDLFFEKKIRGLGKEIFERDFINFQKKIGEVRPHEPLYEKFVDYYLNWFLFEEEKKEKIPFSFVHSLFSIIKNRENLLVVKDIFSGKSITVASDSYTFHGISPQSFIQGFVFASKEKYYLGNGFIIYEPDKNKIIHKFYKKLKGVVSPYAFLKHLANIKLSSDRNSKNRDVFRMKIDSFS